MKKKILIILCFIALIHINNQYGSVKVIGNIIKEKAYNEFIKEERNVGEDLILVNRENTLDEDYVPNNLKEVDVNCYPNMLEEEMQMTEEAAGALKRMFGEAEDAGVILYAISGYRSYETQKELYENSVKNMGKEYTNKYVAKPGASEHQSGLAMDITNEQKSTGFEYTKEGMWLQKNAHKFGFIIRYGKGKEKITGYNYEPWHVRYVGTKNSEAIYSADITLEEFLSSK